MRGDFILECIIQLEGGVKKRRAVKVPIAGKLTRWLQDKRRKIKREGRGGRGVSGAMPSAGCTSLFGLGPA